MSIKKILLLLIIPLIGLLLMAAPITLLVRSILSPSVLTMDAPGTADFEVMEPGTYSVWRKTAGVIDDLEFRSDSPEMPEGLSIIIHKNDDGSTVPLEEYLGSSATSGGSSKHSLVKAELHPGNYSLITKSADPVSLVVQKNSFDAKYFFLVLVLGMIGFLVLMGGMLYAGIVIIRSALKKPASGPPGV